MILGNDRPTLLGSDDGYTVYFLKLKLNLAVIETNDDENEYLGSAAGYQKPQPKNRNHIFLHVKQCVENTMQKIVF